MSEYPTTDPVLYTDLLPHERLRLWRKRMNLSRIKAAATLRISAWRYEECERGLDSLPLNDVPWHGPDALRPHEKCVIYRARAGVSQAEVGAEMGKSRLWVCRMERGEVACDDLLWYWEQ